MLALSLEVFEKNGEQFHRVRIIILSAACYVVLEQVSETKKVK